MNYITLMRPIIQKAGDLALVYFRKDFSVSLKGQGSIQTNVDLLCEDLLKTELCAALPGSGFIAEESKTQNQQTYTWVIDPIDGTRNFVRGISYFCVTVALLHGDEVIAAMTYQPVGQDWFWAQKGCGFWHNGVRIQRGLAENMDESTMVVVSDFLLRQAGVLDELRDGLKRGQRGVKFRVNGAVALDLAYAASGMFDLVIFQNLALWDMAAGMLLMTEAGGIVFHDKIGKKGEKMLIAGSEIEVQAALGVLQKRVLH